METIEVYNATTSDIHDIWDGELFHLTVKPREIVYLDVHLPIPLGFEQIRRYRGQTDVLPGITLWRNISNTSQSLWSKKEDRHVMIERNAVFDAEKLGVVVSEEQVGIYFEQELTKEQVEVLQLRVAEKRNKEKIAMEGLEGREERVMKLILEMDDGSGVLRKDLVKRLRAADRQVLKEILEHLVVKGRITIHTFPQKGSPQLIFVVRNI